jgi:hypothetical protein
MIEKRFTKICMINKTQTKKFATNILMEILFMKITQFNINTMKINHKPNVK